MPTHIQEIVERLKIKAYNEAKRFNQMSLGTGKWKPENFQEWHDAQAIEKRLYK